MLDDPLTAIAVPLSVAVLGYFFSYANNLRLEQRKQKLSRIERQLRDFYGPLMALSSASDEAYLNGFKKLYRTGMPMWQAPTEQPEEKPTAREIEAFHLWAKEVFMPLNRRIHALIVENSDLLEEEEMPEYLLRMLAYASAFEGIIKEWECGNKEHHTPPIRFPHEVRMYALKHYVELKQKQAKLLGAGRGMHSRS